MEQTQEQDTAHATTHIAKLLLQIYTGEAKVVHTLRRKIRYRIFRMREDQQKGWRRKEFDMGLKTWLNAQLEDGRSLNDFTFEWDVSVYDPLQVVVSMQEYMYSGGRLNTAYGRRLKEPVTMDRETGDFVQWYSKKPFADFSEELSEAELAVLDRARKDIEKGEQSSLELYPPVFTKQA